MAYPGCREPRGARGASDVAGEVLTVPILSDGGWPYASSAPIDADDPGRFHALFGRDSLITALAVMPFQPTVARATLRVLATLQGRRDDPETDEEPGKILHEYRPHAEPRFADMGWPVRDGELRYYGSADSTSWFLVVLATLGDAALSDELSESWRAASRWLEQALARGGGLVRYGPRLASGGLVHQGWRDTTDACAAYGGGILHRDGRVPEPPLADADTQAVAVAALRASGRLSGEPRWQSLAARTVDLVGDALTPDTMALSGDGERIAGAGSQLGWLLWADALPGRRARPLRSGSASLTCLPISACARCPPSILNSPPRHTTGEQSGPSTRGLVGAACALRAARPRRSECEAACSRR